MAEILAKHYKYVTMDSVGELQYVADDAANIANVTWILHFYIGTAMHICAIMHTLVISNCIFENCLFTQKYYVK